MSPRVFVPSRLQGAREILQRTGVTIVEDIESASVLWVGRERRRLFHELRSDQAINHVPGQRHLTDKGLLTMALRRRPATSGDHPLAFYPQTWVLDVDADRARLRDAVGGDDLWILKPAGLAEGHGISVVTGDTLATDDDLWRSIASRGSRRYVVQRYVDDPLLLAGRKSSFRLWLLMIATHEVALFVSRAGLVPTSAHLYDVGELSTPAVHATNTRLQRDHPDFEPSVAGITPEALETRLVAAGSAAPGWWPEVLRPELHRQIAETVAAAHDHLTVSILPGLHFGFLAVDWVLDANLRPWLTEFQFAPSLRLTYPEIAETKATLIRDALFLVEAALRLPGPDRDLDALEARGSYDRIALPPQAKRAKR